MDAIERHPYRKDEIVYRAWGEGVEVGVVVKIEPCRIDSYGNIWPDENGDRTLYTARFRSGYEKQTYSWKFWPTLAAAEKDLERQLRRRINDARRDIQRLEERIAQVQAGNHTVMMPT